LSTLTAWVSLVICAGVPAISAVEEKVWANLDDLDHRNHPATLVGLTNHYDPDQDR
jgi:hypothetical protein